MAGFADSGLAGLCRLCRGRNMPTPGWPVYADYGWHSFHPLVAGLRRSLTGHAYTEQSLENGLAVAGDEASWNALRAMQERLFFVEHMARVRRDAGDVFNAERLVAKGLLLQRRVEELRGFLESPGIESEDPP